MERSQKVVRNRFTGEEYPINSVEELRAGLDRINRPWRNMAAALLPVWTHARLLGVQRPGGRDARKGAGSSST